MEIDVNIGPQGHIYLVKNVRKNWGRRLKLTPNLTAIVIYPHNAHPKDILRSLETLQSEFQHRVEILERQKHRESKG